jgi:tRNA G18 (ribose-2'-O)-methylase SpoU
MEFIEVSDLNAPQLQAYKTLRENKSDENGGFVADSPKVVNTLLKTDIQIQSMLATKEYYDMHKELIAPKNVEKCYVASKALMQTIVGHTIHHNVMAYGIRPQPSAVDALDDGIIMLENVTSAQNIGAIARSAAATGVRSYVLSARSPHPYARRALRVSMGHMSKLNYHIYDDIFATIAALKKCGYKIYGAEIAPDSTPLSQVKVSRKWVLLMGSEGHGLSKELIEACDEIVTIEMASGVQSFNVAVASSILMYSFSRSLHS